MHEMSLAEGILGVIEDAARAQGFARVTRVGLEIGALAGVEVEALQFCLEVVLRDSLAHGAEIELHRTPGQGWCMHCCVSVPIAALYDPCPRCGGHKVQVTGGNDMRVRDLMVE